MKHSLLRYTRYRKLNYILICVTFLFFVCYSINHRFHVSIDQQQLYIPNVPFKNNAVPPPPPAFQDHLDNLSLGDIITANATVSQISIKRCLKLFSCQPFPRTNPQNNLWVKYKSPLNLYAAASVFRPSSWFNYHLYVQYQQLHHSSRVLADVQVASGANPPKSKVASHPNGEWVAHSLFGSNHDYQIWHYYVTPQSSSDRESIAVIRDIDVLFGGNDLSDDRPHWHYHSKSMSLPFSSPSSITPHLTVLKFDQVHAPQILSDLHSFDYFKQHNVMLAKNENFKIIQLSDLHFGQDTGKCVVQSSHNHCKSDFRTIKFVEAAIRHERPDLIVITGDLIDAHRTQNFKSVILKALSPVLKSQVPFIFTFGESDFHNFDPKSKNNILNFIASLPRCFNNDGSHKLDNMHGLTNYNLKVYYEQDVDKLISNNLAAATPLAMVTVLDSHDRKIDASQLNYLYRINGQLSNDLKNSKRVTQAKRELTTDAESEAQPNAVDQPNHEAQPAAADQPNSEPNAADQPNHEPNAADQSPHQAVDQPEDINQPNHEAQPNKLDQSNDVDKPNKVDQPNEVEEPSNIEADNQLPNNEPNGANKEADSKPEEPSKQTDDKQTDESNSSNDNVSEQPPASTPSLPSDTHKLLFFHYPLPNFRPKGKFKLIGGYNMKNPLNSKSDASLKDEIINCGYHVVAVGHEHENDACIQSYRDSTPKGASTPADAIAESEDYLWLCYNSITGDSGDTNLDDDYERKLRVFHVDARERKLMSWKVRESDSSGFDYQIIRDFS